MMLVSELPTRILVVDDKAADALVSMLSVVSNFYVATAVSNGEEALRVLEKEPFDIILSDLVLPGNMDGVKVTAAIRREHPSARIIVFSGQESSERKRAVLDAGAFMFLGKPIVNDELRHVIESINEIRRKEIFGDKFQTLTRIAYDLQATLEFDELAERIVRGAKMLGFDRARLYLFDEKRQVLLGKASQGMPPDFNFAGYEIPFTAQPIIRGVFEQDRPTVWNQEELRKKFTADPEPWLSELGLGAICWIDCPLVVGSQRIGTLSLDHHAHPGHPGYLSEDIQVMGILAGLASHSLNNATLYQREQLANASLNSILHDSPDAVVATDLHGTITLASPSFERLTGTAPNETVGQRASDFYTDELGSREAGQHIAQTIMEELQKSKLLTNRPVFLRTSSGKACRVLISVSLLHDATGRDIGTVGMLKESTPPDPQIERYRNLLEGFGYGTVLLDAHGKIIFLNSKASRLMERSENLSHGLEFIEVLPEYQRPFFVEASQQVLKTTKTISLELSLLRPSGRNLPVQAELTPHLNQGKSAGVQVALYGTKELAALMQSGRLMALGEMLANMAHEANNPLNNIQIAFNSLQEALVERHPAAAAELDIFLGIIARNSERIADLIWRLKEFARPREFRREPVRVGDLIEDALALFGNQLRDRDIEVEVRLAEELPPVLGEPTRLQQVLVNLISNANEAMEGQEAPKWIRIESYRDGHQAVIRFQDGGPGVPLAIRGSLFEPFVTMKTSGRGIGLGLAISKSILDLHEGEIELVSRDSETSCFEIRLPLYESNRQLSSSVSQEGSDADDFGS
jgi:PAS domain S-box-containing protein